MFVWGTRGSGFDSRHFDGKNNGISVTTAWHAASATQRERFDPARFHEGRLLYLIYHV